MPYTKHPKGRGRLRGIVEPCNFEIETDLHKRLKKFCQDRGHSKRWVLTQAVQDYLRAAATSDEET